MTLNFDYKKKDFNKVFLRTTLINLIINVVLDIIIVVLGILYLIFSNSDGAYQIYLGYIFIGVGILLFLYSLFKEYKTKEKYASIKNENDKVSYEISGSEIKGDIFTLDNISSIKIYNILNVIDTKNYIILLLTHCDFIYFPKDQLSNLDCKNILNVIKQNRTISRKK